MDCKQRVLAYWQGLERIARMRFPDANLADQGLLYVMEQLAADNWQRVRGFGDRSSFRQYVSCLAVRLLEDFSRKKFGRPRPPAWLKRLGPLWEMLYRRLCLERLPVAEAVEVVLRSGPGYRSREAVEEVAFTILGRIVTCGESIGEVLPFDEEQEQLLDHAGSGCHPTAESELGAQQRRAALDVLLDSLLPHDPDGERPPALSSDFCRRLQQALALPLRAEDQLLLRMVYQDGLKVSEAARLLTWTPARAHGRLRTILDTLRKRLHDAGLAQELNHLLEQEK